MWYFGGPNVNKTGLAMSKNGGQQTSLADLVAPILATSTVFFTYALVVLGSTVRVTESGMGCPSWPLCYGKLTPIDRLHPLLEQSHRYLASIVTVLVFATLVAVLRSDTHRSARKPALISSGLVVFQVILGAVTVLTKNAPWTVAAHLLTALAFLAITTLTAIMALGGDGVVHPSRSTMRWGWIALASTFLLMISGTLVVDGGASSSCPSWPTCNQGPTSALVALNLTHRSIAALAGLSIFAFLKTSWREGRSRRSWRLIAYGSVALLFGAGTLGAITAISKARPTFQDIHLALGAALWISLVALVSTLRKLPSGENLTDSTSPRGRPRLDQYDKVVHHPTSGSLIRRGCSPSQRNNPRHL